MKDQRKWFQAAPGRSRKDYVIDRVVKHCNRLPWEAEESPSLEISNRYADVQMWCLVIEFCSGLGSVWLNSIILRVFSHLSDTILQYIGRSILACLYTSLLLVPFTTIFVWVVVVVD